MNRRDFISLFGLAPAAALVTPKAVLEPLDQRAPEYEAEPSGDAAWLRCARLGAELHKVFRGEVICSNTASKGSWVLKVSAERHEIFLGSDVSFEEAIFAVKVMLRCMPGLYTPEYAGGYVMGVARVR